MTRSLVLQASVTRRVGSSEARYFGKKIERGADGQGNVNEIGVLEGRS